MNDEGSYIDEDLIRKYKDKYMELMERLDFSSIDIGTISSSRPGSKNIRDSSINKIKYGIWQTRSIFPKKQI